MRLKLNDDNNSVVVSKQELKSAKLTANILTVFDLSIEESESTETETDDPVVMQVAVSFWCDYHDPVLFCLMVIPRTRFGVPLAACSIFGAQMPTECFEQYSGFLMSRQASAAIHDYLLILHGVAHPTNGENPFLDFPPYVRVAFGLE